ncbi:hypothetical protein MMC12_002966 [Toensbergia leucococca]|nr:hypothetical protein [Toensbergia leucococca]
MEGNRTNASIWEKFLVVPALLLTTLVATTLFATRLDHWASSPAFANFVVLNRSASGIFVQIISHILGMIHVYTLCTTINLSSRAYLSNKSFPLVLVKFLNAICGNRLDLSLPWLHRFALIMFIVITLLPSALWAGALTPVLSLKNTAQQIMLPAYSNTTLLKGMPYHSALRNIYNVNTDKGLFTYAPEFDLQGTMLDLAAGASNRTRGTNTTSAHSKLDKTNYVYAQRSYGVGASVGLTDDGLLDSTKRYKYYELGFQAETSCIYNETSNFYLSDNILPEDSGWLLEVFEAAGSLPWGNDNINFATVGFNSGAIVALITASNDSNHILAITTGANGTEYYARLNDIQCDISFTPRNFSVAVDRENQTVSVSAMDAAPVAWPSYGDMVVDGAVLGISTMAQALCSTTYVSILGQTLMYNVANVEAAQGISNSSNLLGVADAVTSVMDNFLVSYASAQLMVAKDQVKAGVESQVTALVIGTPAYVFPIFALNLVICLVYLIEVFRTRGWRHLPRFNFMDIKSVIIGTSIGGPAIADRAKKLHDAQSSVRHPDKDDHAADHIHIQLDQTPRNAVAIVLAAEEKEQSFQPSPIHLGSKRREGDGVFLLQDFGVPGNPTTGSEITEPDSSFSSSFQEYEGMHQHR